MSDLENQRTRLHEYLLDQTDEDAHSLIINGWPLASSFIANWWREYKVWESEDTFNDAVRDNRMAMRSFGSAFERQVEKTKPVGITKGRFYTGNVTEVNTREKGDFDIHDQAFNDMGLAPHKRGLDTSAYAIPANFASRASKYSEGLHDVSMRLVVNGADIKASSHHLGEANPHFLFLALSKGEDQYVLHKLKGYAKALRIRFPALDDLIRGYRAEMSQVKLANNYDMGTGYTATPTSGREDGLTYKVTYGLGNTIKERGRMVPIPTTMSQIQLRRQMYFRHRADIVKYPANEIIVAMRKHNGPFPVLAEYHNGLLRCFKIVGGQKQLVPGECISACGLANWCA